LIGAIFFLFFVSSYLYYLNLSLQVRVSVLVDENALLRSRVDFLESKLDELQSDYDCLNSEYNLLYDRYLELQDNYTYLYSEYQLVKLEYDELKSDFDLIFKSVSSDCVAMTVVYYTGFGVERHVMTLSIPYKLYNYYVKKFHPDVTIYNLKVARQYITPNEPVIMDIVSRIKGQTSGGEELVDALLDFVQDKFYTLCVWYYPTIEFKYPIETLVEMGGDCDTHAFLYASLLKVAGFKVLLAFTADGTHVVVAIHLSSPPEHNIHGSAWYFTFNGLKYYFAETTSWGWRVSDLPEELKDAKWKLIEV